MLNTKLPNKLSLFDSLSISSLKILIFLINNAQNISHIGIRVKTDRGILSRFLGSPTIGCPVLASSLKQLKTNYMLVEVDRRKHYMVLDIGNETVKKLRSFLSGMRAHFEENQIVGSHSHLKKILDE